ncbi:aminoglycoside phosphotransferase family protein [Candidatus Woesearchaeota archaeon]|nr:aminoglycoside phosphotransferase family protein [Candidatus Woesearchaeota archaeon]
MANKPVSVIAELLGDRKYHALVDKILLKRLLSELYDRGQRYADVREKIQREEFSLEEEVDCVKDGFRAGRLRLVIPESNFGMASFYRIAFSKEKSSEIARDYEISNFLQDRGVKTPSVVYKAGGFTATEFVRGESFLKVLRDEEANNTNKRTAKVQEEVLDQIAKYHTLPLDQKIKRILDNGQLQKYSFSKFVKAIAAGQKRPVSGTDAMLECWKESIDDYLTATGTGILHNDLHNENIIVHYNHPTIIDWGDATMGPVHYDVCRLLLTSGFFNETYKEEIDALSARCNRKSDGKPVQPQNGSQQKIEAIFDRHFAAAAPSLERKLFPSSSGIEWNSERFYHAFNRAHASTRLRLAGSTYKLLQVMKKNNAFDRLLTTEEKELLENLPSYHFTWCLKALQKEGLHGVASDLESLVLETGMHRKPECGAVEDGALKDYSMEEFIQKYNPDVNSWVMLQKIQDKLGLVEKETETQETDIRNKARRRKLKFLSRIAAGATILIGGALGAYTKYVQPEQERIREEIKVVGHLAENWPQDFSDKVMLIYEFPHLKYKYQTVHSTKLVPAIANFLYVPSTGFRERVDAQFNQFNETHLDIPVLFDVKACLKDGETISLCYPHQLSSEEQLKQKRKELGGSRTSCLDDHTTLPWEFQWEKGGLTRFDYYESKSISETVESLEYLYFRLPGLIRAIERVSGDKFNEQLDDAAKSSGYDGDDARFKAHLFASSLAQRIKPSGNIAEAYVGIFCPDDAVLLHAQNSTEKMFVESELPCAEDARNAYFTFLRMNGLDLETSVELKHKVEDEYQLILSIKENSPGVKVDSSEVGETLLGLTKLGYVVSSDTLQLKLAVVNSMSEPLEKHMDELRTGREVNSACESLGTINAHEEMLNCEYFWSLARDKLAQVEKLSYNLYGIGLRGANRQQESVQMTKVMSCNFRAAELLSSLEIRGLYNDDYLMGLAFSENNRIMSQDEVKFNEELLGEDMNQAQRDKNLFKLGGQCGRWLYELHQQCYLSGDLSKETYHKFLDAADTLTQSYEAYTELALSILPSGINNSADLLLPSFPGLEEKK